MKKILLPIIAFLFVYTVKAQQIFFQTDFENGIPSKMTIVDNAGTANQTRFKKAWAVASWTSSPNKLAFSSSENIQSDYWMILPPVTLPANANNCYILYKAMSGDSKTGYRVMVSTTGKAIKDFKVLFDRPAEGQSLTDYAKSLKAYAGKTIYLAFWNNSNRKQLISIDDIVVADLPDYDAGITVVDVPEYVKQNSAINIKGTVKNFGAQSMTSVDINYSVNGGAIQTYNLSNINVVPFGTKSFTHSQNFNISSSAAYNVKVWTSNINGNKTDGDASNDTLVKATHALAFLPQKKILYEEPTGTWCGWCPRGTVFMDSMRTIHGSEVSLVSAHNNDPMMNSAYDSRIRKFISGFPHIVMDRKRDGDPSVIFNDYNAHKNEISPVKVLVDKSYDSNTRQLTVNVSGVFATEYGNANLRFAAIVGENDVTGTATGYAQSNYYSYRSQNKSLTGPRHNWQSEPSHVPASDMIYDMVGRALLGGFDGKAGSIPSQISINDSLSQQFTYTIPAGYDADNIYVIGVIIDNTTGYIVNSDSKGNRPISTGIQEQSVIDANVKVYPNPVSNIANVEIAMKENAETAVNVYNMLGQKVMQIGEKTLSSGTHNYQLDFANMQNGIYFIKVNVGDKIITKKISVVR